MRAYSFLVGILALAEHASGFTSVPACSSDVIRSQRLATLASFFEPFQAFTRLPWNATLTLDEFMEALAPYVEADFEVIVAYGTADYTGLRKASEYLLVGMPPANVGFYSPLGTAGFASVVEEGDSITVESTTKNQLFLDQHVKVALESSFKFDFNPCGSRIRKWEILPTSQIMDFASNFVWAANYSTYQGTYDICMYHEAYCTGEYRQYESFDACLSYLSNSVPLLSAACADKAPLAGFSRTCKLKHKFMSAYEQNHCFHLGPATLPDGSPNYDKQGELVCNDEIECERWSGGPPITIGSPPDSLLAASRAYDEWVVDTWANANGDFDVDNYKFPKGAPPP